MCACVRESETYFKMDSNKAQKIIEDACLILKDSKKYRSDSKQRKKKKQQYNGSEVQYGKADGIQGSRAIKHSPMNSNTSK
jgi:ribosomal protein L19E